MRKKIDDVVDFVSGLVNQPITQMPSISVLDGYMGKFNSLGTYPTANLWLAKLPPVTIHIPSTPTPMSDLTFWLDDHFTENRIFAIPTFIIPGPRLSQKNQTLKEFADEILSNLAIFRSGEMFDKLEEEKDGEFKNNSD
jgi:hypothetical protein